MVLSEPLGGHGPVPPLDPPMLPCLRTKKLLFTFSTANKKHAAKVNKRCNGKMPRRKNVNEKMTDENMPHEEITLSTNYRVSAPQPLSTTYSSGKY